MAISAQHREPDELLSLERVAAALAVSRAQVGRLIRRGDLRIIRIGPRTVRVARAELDRFISLGSMVRRKQSAP
jgi:excisionase family DNA binding protein